MNPSDQLDYVLGLLDEPRRAEFDGELALDPFQADRVEHLEVALRRLLDDGDGPEPPADLARRTIARVEEYRRRPRRSILEYVPARVPFRWADVAVAAGILLAALATLVPAIRNSQIQARQLGCASNLQRIGVGLNQYVGAKGHYPYIDPDEPTPYAGTFALVLNQHGFLRDPKLLNCPCGDCPAVPDPLPDLDTLRTMDAKAPRSAPCLNNVSYAYNLGYRHDDNKRPGPVPAHAPGLLPILADRPPYESPGRILDGNSRNHHGAGQNVLFVDGHVGFYPTRRVGLDPDIYLNAAHQPAPADFMLDAVLAPGTVRFDGR